MNYLVLLFFVNIFKGKCIFKLCMRSICKFCGLFIILYNNIKFLNGKKYE